MHGPKIFSGVFSLQLCISICAMRHLKETCIIQESVVRYSFNVMLGAI